MTRTVEVRPSPATAMPGDEAQTVGPVGPTGPGEGGETVAEPFGPGRYTIHGADGTDAWATTGLPRLDRDGWTTVEVVVDGWRFELEVEDARRATLRRRATRAPDAAATSGPTEIRAIIPGRIAAIRVQAGDQVEAGQSLLVVEAMKMQNELRAPRAGTVDRIAVEDGATIDNGDLLVVLR